MCLGDILGELEADYIYAGRDIVDFLILSSLFHNLASKRTCLTADIRSTS